MGMLEIHSVALRLQQEIESYNFFLGLKGGKHFIALSWELAEEMLRQMAEVFLEYVMLHLNAWDGTKSS